MAENTTQWKYYNSDNWVPHCTVGIDIPEDKFSKAFFVLQESFFPITATIEKICITKFRPSIILYENNI